MSFYKASRKKANRLFKSQHTSFLTAVCGFAVHVASFVPIIAFTPYAYNSSLEKIYIVLCIIWLVAPFPISMFGMLSGCFYLLYRNIAISPFIGILLNIIWFLIFLLFFYVFVVVGVSV